MRHSWVTREPGVIVGGQQGVHRHLKVGGQLAVLLYGLLVVCDRLLGCLHTLLGLPDPRACHVQLLPQLQLCLTCVFLQLIIHLIHRFLGGHKAVGAKERQSQGSRSGWATHHTACPKVRGHIGPSPSKCLPNTLYLGGKSGVYSLTKSPTVSLNSRTFSSRFRFRSVSISTISSAPRAASTCVTRREQGERAAERHLEREGTGL